MRLIPLTQGKFAKIDDADFDWLSQWKWYYSKGYAVRNSPRVSGKRHAIYMHRLIANTPDGLETDHRDGNKIDNQRRNLRPCTTSQNKMNTGLQANNSSGFRGVHWSKRDKIWQSYIKLDGKLKHLGCYGTDKEAAHAHDVAALKFHGEFARLNLKRGVR